MMDSDILNIRNVLRNENFKKIEDIIDAGKRLGHYNIYHQSKPRNFKSSCSNFQRNISETNRSVKFDESSLISNDKDISTPENGGVKYTDSEITIVRVKCVGTVFNNRRLNRWDMNDIAIPGDGTHLGESPSLVNLVTLVRQNIQCEGDDEYLVPLSSWEPLIKNEEFHWDMKSNSDSKINETYSLRSSFTDTNLNLKMEEASCCSQTDFLQEITLKGRRASWPGKTSKHWCKHWRNTKSLDESENL